MTAGILERKLEIMVRYRVAVACFYLFCSFFTYSGTLSFFDGEVNFILLLPVVLKLFIWSVLLQDIIREKIYHKTFWIISMIVLSSFAPVFYLFQRKEVGGLKNDLFTRGRFS